jgi:hypothetical protein
MLHLYNTFMKNTSVIIAFLFCYTAHVSAQAIDTNQLKKHISYLASDRLQGRAPGTKGEKRAAHYIADHFRQLGLEAKGDKGFYQVFSYRQPAHAHDTGTAKRKKYSGRNVMGYLNNQAAYTVVIGAHFDHLGNDGRNQSLEKEPKGKIHNGADDNASGTAGVMELARYYATNSQKENANFLFICFSAEEAGLIGSKYFTQHPTIDLSTINFMLNMDMIGRLVDSTRKLLIFGTGTSDVFEPVLQEINRNRFQLVLDSSGIGPSDQTSFYLKKIPVLHFFTGQHSDYHKSTDDVEKINFPGQSKVLDFIIEVMDTILSLPKLKFYETRKNDDVNKTAFKVTLGIMPDYGFQGKGVRIDAVNKDKPAEKAGLKGGDIIIKLGHFAIENIHDYMKALSHFKKNDKISIQYQRQDQILNGEAEF